MKAEGLNQKWERTSEIIPNTIVTKLDISPYKMMKVSPTLYWREKYFIITALKEY